MLLLTEDISLSEKTVKTILKDGEKAAGAVDLIYVNDRQQGIKRVKQGRNFIYVSGRRKIKNKGLLNRIKKLVIPPAWKDVWICNLENGHLQATGFDLKKRKQYKYHSLWSSLRNHTKFYGLYAFGKAVPEIRKHIEQDLSLPGLPPQKVLAIVVCLMERTSIRVGNNMYEKLYGSFGLTTLKDQHVKINGNELKFSFKGKKGIMQNVSVKNKRLAALVKECRDVPGKELFQYYGEDGKRHKIDSGMVNAYIKKISGHDFSAKDFRTWAGTVQALMAFKELGSSDTATGTKKKIVAALDMVAAHLGNTRTVCKKYYVHPVLIHLYETGKLDKYLKGSGRFKKCSVHDLECEEKQLMKILHLEKTEYSS
ncbi:MAG: topoisomerase [Bacteroidetes bacterium]|nr:topoisomerase [Bacteroidota bacterium]